MNAEPLRTIATRAAERLGKSPEFKLGMLARLREWYDLDAPAPPVIGGGWMIVAGVSANVTWTPAYWEWQDYLRRTK